MSVGAGVYAVVYRQFTEVASPPGDWLLSLTEFQFGTINDYDVDIVRGNGFVSIKGLTSVRITALSVSGDGIIEARITIRRALPLWDDIP